MKQKNKSGKKFELVMTLTYWLIFLGMCSGVLGIALKSEILSFIGVVIAFSVFVLDIYTSKIMGKIEAEVWEKRLKESMKRNKTVFYAIGVVGSCLLIVILKIVNQ